MQFYYSTFLFVICSALADEAPVDLKGKQQKALLILPPQLTIQNNTTPQPDQNVTENADNVTDNVLERFRQLQGSVTNVYYISLPDGNVQKLEYIRTPIEQQETQESQPQYPGPANNQQTFYQYSHSSRQPGSSTPQGNQQTNHQEVIGTNKQSNQANQQQYNKFQAQQQFTVSNLQQPQYTQFQRPNSYNKEIESDNPNQVFAQYNVENSPNKPTSYVANVRFTDVPAVHGPVYAYSTSPLVRIVRFANNFHQ